MRILKRHFFVRSLVAILLSSTSLAVWAEFDNVVVNGAAIDAAEFQRYKDNQLVARECYPETNKLVLHRVISGLLLASSNEVVAGVSEATPDESELLYLQLLSENSPLVVDVVMLRTASMTFSNRVDAEEVLERLQVGEKFDDIAIDVEQTGYDFDSRKETWHHASTLGPTLDEQPVTVGSLLNTWFDGISWQVRQVLELTYKPVLLLDDIVMSPTDTVQSTMDSVAHSSRKQDLTKRLWESTNISVEGKPLAYSDESYCGYPKLQLNTKL